MTDNFKNEYSQKSPLRPSIDISLLACIVLLIGIGLGFLYSASQPAGEKYYNDQYYFIMRQVLYFTIGLLFFAAGFFINHHVYKKFVKLMVLGTTALLILTLIPGIGKNIGGARRWIVIWKLSIQPSELAKVTIIIYLAAILDKKQDAIRDFYKGVLPPLIITGLLAFFILIENDFSTTFLIIFVAMLMLYLGGIQYFTFIMLGMLGATGSLLSIILAPYRVKRMFAFLNPWDDPLGSGWHYIQSIKCFAIGKWFGRGIGESSQKDSALPEAHNDYIYAIIAEEGGAFLAIIIILLFTLFAFIGYNIAKKTNNQYSFLLASGITTIIFFQAMINIGVVLSVLPATGIPLPFVSAGGSSMVVFLFMIGMLMNISYTNKLDANR